MQAAPLADACERQPAPKRRGRHPGVPNKITRDVNELAQKHGINALARALARLILMRNGVATGNDR